MVFSSPSTASPSAKAPSTEQALFDAMDRAALRWVEILDSKDAAYREEERRQAKVEEDRINAENARIAREKAEADRKESERVAAEQRKIAEAQAAEARKLRERELEIQRREGEITKRELEKAKKLEAEIAAKAKAMAAIEEEKARELAAAAAREAIANPPTVTVKPNIPSVAGAAKNQTFYYAEMTNPAQIIAAYNQALIQSNLERQRFLQPFLMVNEQAVGKFARDTQDNAKATALVPGVRFWSKG